MRNIKLTIAYDGSDYVGWQVQPNGVSVQGKLETAWEEITQEKIRITASGRTDSGVHARGQVCNLKTESSFAIERIPFALTSQTPFDISVLKAELAAPQFDVIRDATSKTYRYQIQFGPILDVLNRHYRWHFPKQLDPARMQTAANLLKGTHNFESFQATGSERVTTQRTVTQLDVVHFRESCYDYIDVVVTADGFLYNMVRNIVGSLVRIGVGRESPEWIVTVLESRDRRKAGETAPARGLFLEKVEYEN